MKNKTGLVFLCIGVLLLVLAGADIISIIASVIEKLWNINLYAAFLSSFVFRAFVALLGGILMLIGGYLYKDTSESKGS